MNSAERFEQDMFIEVLWVTVSIVSMYHISKLFDIHWYLIQNYVYFVAANAETIQNSFAI